MHPSGQRLAWFVVAACITTNLFGQNTPPRSVFSNQRQPDIRFGLQGDAATQSPADSFIQQVQYEATPTNNRPPAANTLRQAALPRPINPQPTQPPPSQQVNAPAPQPPTVQPPTTGPRLTLPPQVAPTTVPSAAPPSMPSNTVTLQQIEAESQQVRIATDLDDATRATLLEKLRQATESIKQADGYDQRTQTLQREIATAPSRLNQLREAMDAPLAEVTAEWPAEMQLEEAERKLKEVEAALAQANEKLASNDDTDVQGRADRKVELRNLEAKTKEQIRQRTAETNAPATTLQEGVQQLAARATIHSLQRQLAMYVVERKHFDAFAEIEPLESEWAKRRQTWLNDHATAWREAITTFRNQEAVRKEAEARQRVSEAHPALKDLAERNAALAERTTKLTTKMGSIGSELETTTEIRQTLEKDLERIKKRIDAAGMTPANGLLLRNRRDHLPDLTTHRTRLREVNSEMQEINIALIEAETDREELPRLSTRISDVVQNLEATPTLSRQQIGAMSEELLARRHEHVVDLEANYTKYHEALSNLAQQSEDLIKLGDEYALYIDQRVLWIRSEQPLSANDLHESVAATKTFVDVQAWQAVFSGVVGNVIDNPLMSGLVIVTIICLFVSRSRVLQRLERTGQLAKNNDRRFLPTLEACLLTVINAGVWPMLWFGLAWWTGRGATSPLATDIASGMRAVALALFTMELFRQICRPQGLGSNHFGWNDDVLSGLYRGLTVLVTFGLPLVFLVAMIETHGDGEGKNSIGRIAFMTASCLIAFVLHSLLRARGGVLHEALAGSESTAVARMRHVGCWIAVTIPLALAALVGLGYSYTAHALADRFMETAWMVAGVIMIHAMISRALLALRTRIAVRRMANAKTNDAKDQSPNETSDVDDCVETSDEDVAVSIEEEQADVEAAGKHIPQFLRGVALVALLLGASWIWADMFPALRALDGVQLPINKTIYVSDGVTETKPITLADVTLALLALAGTVVAVRTLPGLVDVTILQRLPIDRGARNAVVILARYGLMILGAMVSLRFLGVTWQSLQWLAAAMSVGLGFGLQEIFCNLVSGVIVLFERPIRIGDLITVGGTTGRVQNIRIRATTIIDLDRRETVIPNRRFITEDVINWTLSDPVTRFIAPVGISYECDPSLAHKVLLQVAAEHPMILEQPAPSAVFTEFGDSTLNLELRAFIPNRDDHPCVLHEVNVAIERAFRKANLEIAFPQQDLHIRSISPELLQAGKAEATLKAA